MFRVPANVSKSTTLNACTIPNVTSSYQYHFIARKTTSRRPVRSVSKESSVIRSKAQIDENPSQNTSETKSKLSLLAESLLFNAASLLNSDRKTAHCVACHGTGIVTCSACAGKGVLAPEKVAKMNSMKHAVHKLTQMFAKESASMFDNDWMLTNRCKRCKGTGRLLCTACQGTGRRSTLGD